MNNQTTTEATEVEELKEDIRFLLKFVPWWAASREPGLCPAMYGTGSGDGDEEYVLRVESIVKKVQ